MHWIKLILNCPFTFLSSLHIELAKSSNIKESVALFLSRHVDGNQRKRRVWLKFLLHSFIAAAMAPYVIHSYSIQGRSGQTLVVPSRCGFTAVDRSDLSSAVSFFRKQSAILGLFKEINFEFEMSGFSHEMTWRKSDKI